MRRYNRDRHLGHALALNALAQELVPPMQWFAVLFVAVAGVLNTIQSGANGQLAKSLGSPWPAVIAIYVIGLVSSAIILPFVSIAWPTLAKLADTPWWAWLGGVLGTMFVMGMLLFAQKLGSGVYAGVSVTAAIIASLLADHFGLVGFKEHPLTLWRAVGGALMIGGLGLVASF